MFILNSQDCVYWQQSYVQTNSWYWMWQVGAGAARASHNLGLGPRNEANSLHLPIVPPSSQWWCAHQQSRIEAACSCVSWQTRADKIVSLSFTLLWVSWCSLLLPHSPCYGVNLVLKLKTAFDRIVTNFVEVWTILTKNVLASFPLRASAFDGNGQCMVEGDELSLFTSYSTLKDVQPLHWFTQLLWPYSKYNWSMQSCMCQKFRWIKEALAMQCRLEVIWNQIKVEMKSELQIPDYLSKLKVKKYTILRKWKPRKKFRKLLLSLWYWRCANLVWEESKRWVL